MLASLHVCTTCHGKVCKCAYVTHPLAFQSQPHLLLLYVPCFLSMRCMHALCMCWDRELSLCLTRPGVRTSLHYPSPTAYDASRTLFFTAAPAAVVLDIVALYEVHAAHHANALLLWQGLHTCLGCHGSDVMKPPAPVAVLLDVFSCRTCCCCT
jgi:hypothetical protein